VRQPPAMDQLHPKHLPLPSDRLRPFVRCLSDALGATNPGCGRRLVLSRWPVAWTGRALVHSLWDSSLLPPSPLTSPLYSAPVFFPAFGAPCGEHVHSRVVATLENKAKHSFAPLQRQQWNGVPPVVMSAVPFPSPLAGWVAPKNQPPFGFIPFLCFGFLLWARLT
jgi:hypothetical protein